MAQTLEVAQLVGMRRPGLAYLPAAWFTALILACAVEAAAFGPTRVPGGHLKLALSSLCACARREALRYNQTLLSARMKCDRALTFQNVLQDEAGRPRGFKYTGQGGRSEGASNSEKSSS